MAADPRLFMRQHKARVDAQLSAAAWKAWAFGIIQRRSPTRSVAPEPSPDTDGLPG